MRQFVRFGARRALLAIPQIFLISVFTFFVVRLMPGNPAYRLAGTQATPEVIRGIEHSLGLDRPVLEQYRVYLSNLLHGDWGRSVVTGRNVRLDIADRLPATLELVTASMIVIVVAGVLLGTTVAMAKRRVLNGGLRLYSQLAGAFPDFWLALVLAYVFFYLLGWAPSPSGQLDLGMIDPEPITHMLVVDSALAGDWAAFRSALGHLVLPVTTLVLVYMAPIVKITKTTVEEMLRSEYCRYARACGLSEWTVARYALKNSLPPVISMVGIIYGFLLGGAVLVENVYSWGGIGSYAVIAVQSGDYFAIQAFVLVAAILNVVVFLAVDLFHFWIDPRLEV